jgi:hypothetical protein
MILAHQIRVIMVGHVYLVLQNYSHAIVYQNLMVKLFGLNLTKNLAIKAN